MKRFELVMAQRLKSLPIPDAECARAVELVEQGEELAELLIALGRLVRGLPAPKPVLH